MSWWVSLEQKNGEIVEVPHFSEGGTRCLGGSTEADLNVTYNYSPLFRTALHPDGIEWLSGKQAVVTLVALATAVKKLGIEEDKDYWAATPGNAGRALFILLTWATMHLYATWHVR